MPRCLSTLFLPRTVDGFCYSHPRKHRQSLQIPDGEQDMDDKEPWGAVWEGWQRYKRGALSQKSRLLRRWARR